MAIEESELDEAMRRALVNTEYEVGDSRVRRPSPDAIAKARKTLMEAGLGTSNSGSMLDNYIIGVKRKI